MDLMDPTGPTGSKATLSRIGVFASRGGIRSRESTHAPVASVTDAAVVLIGLLAGMILALWFPVLLHELAHAAAVVFVGARLTGINVGTGPSVEIMTGGITVKLGMVPRGGRVQFYARDARRALSKGAAVTAAGPLSHLAIFAVGASILANGHGPIAIAAFFATSVNAYLLAANLVPRNGTLEGNDGAGLVAYIRTRRSPTTRLESTASVLVGWAAAARAARDTAAVTILTESALALEPRGPIRHQRAVSLAIAGRSAEAAAERELSLAQDVPEDQRASILNSSAWTNMGNGDPDRSAQALQDATESIGIAPDNRVYWITYALALADNGDARAALAVMERMSLDGLPDFNRAAGLCAHALGLLGEGRHKEGRCMINKAARLNGPPDVLAYTRSAAAQTPPASRPSASTAHMA